MEATVESTLTGTAALVTGASSGIGRATAGALAREGADLTITARRESRLSTLASELRAEFDADVHVRPTDVRDPEQVRATVDAAVDRHGELDVAVNNAGTGVEGDPVETSPAEFRAITETNVHGTFYVTQAVLPKLEATSGNLVFVGSFAGEYPFPANPVYAATKGWVRSFAHSMEARAGEDDVAVTLVNPGGVRTGFEFEEGLSQRERYEAGEAPEPEEVAEAIAFACKRSDATTVHEVSIYPRRQLSDSW
ncbi:SDR family oxidoreductase [Halorarum halobium]|uniref:SDR family oxidoreductase n=1 Tax=Halorarum halobium TaxID=3075121 RepID=UPI0028A9AAF1|nr:SDR family oxidoreductase [Halobaculum sp. XH14]